MTDLDPRITPYEREGMTIPCIQDGQDLIVLIERRIALVDSLNEAWASRRASRPHGQQIYRDRANRQHAERMAAATAFKGERM